uniref:Titin n=1 Tax=Chelydra serpentina TaxID=8475 RepID=A0A8C3XLQ9_CHESE
MDGEIREAAIIDITSSFTSLVLDNVNRFDTGKYTLTLENNSGIKSAFVSVRVLDTPSPPVNLKIKEITKDSVSLSWEPPLLDGGAKIKNYIVEKREATRKAYAAVTTNCHKTSWKVDHLQEGNNYYFRVTAENEFGIGLPAETIDPIKVAEVPQPPGKITVDDVTRNSVLLTWSKPEHDGGSKILQYIVEMQVKGSDKWSECASVKALEALITNLTQGEEYLFRVIAVNEKGKSDPRSLAVPVVAKDLVIEPDVRPAFHSYSIQVGQDLKVEIPISGRPKPTVTWTKDGQLLKQTTRVNVNDLPNLTVLNIKETHKEDSGMYGITVANVIGQKSTSVEIITLDKPDPPRGPVKFDDISAEKMFRLEADVHGKPLPTIKWFKGDKELEETARCEIKNTDFKALVIVKDAIRVDGGQYVLQASNIAGTKSVPVNVKVLDRSGPPEGPIQVTGITSEKCSLGRPTPEITWSREEGEFTDKVQIEKGINYTQLSIDNCDRNDTGKYILKLENSSGSKSAFVTVKVLDTPGPPQNLVVKDVKKNYAVLSWELPANDGGAKVKNYVIDKRESTRKAYANVSAKCGKTSFKVENLTEGATYYFRVMAENEFGIGIPAETIDAVKASEPPLPPGKVSLTDVSHTSASLMWEKPEHDGGSRILGYIVEMQPKGIEKWSVVTETKVCSAVVSELEETTARMEIKSTLQRTTLTVKDCVRIDGGHYSLKLSNVGGTKSIPITVKVLDRPGPPEGPLKVTGVTAEKCYLAWAPPLHDGGSSISYYIIEKRETSRLSWTLVASDVQALNHKVTKLLPGNEYIFRVMAVNKYGIGEPLDSEPVVACNPYKRPGPPSVPEVSAITKDSMIVTWGRPIDNGGAEIEGYILEKRDKDGIRWTKCHKKRLTDLRFRVTGLTDGHFYEFRVSAENAAGVGESSEPSIFYRACDAIYPPGPPSNPKVTDTSRSSVSLAWNKYNLTLENNSGKKSAFVNVRVLDSPSAPVNLTIREIKRDSVALAWEPPLIDGGAKITNYIIEKRESTRKA